MLELLFFVIADSRRLWLVHGHRSAQQDKQKHSHQISRQYVTGSTCSYLISQIRRVDHFIELLQVDNETIRYTFSWVIFSVLVVKSTVQFVSTKTSFPVLGSL